MNELMNARPRRAATRTRRHREETSHAALLEISTRVCAPRRRPSASRSIRVSIFRQSGYIATDRGADRARDALKIREGR